MKTPLTLHAWKRELAKVGSDDVGKDAEMRQFEYWMSRRGNRHDDAVAESFFSSLERIRSRTYKTREEVGQDEFDPFEMFCNPVHKQVSNGMLSPVELE